MRQTLLASVAALALAAASATGALAQKQQSGAPGASGMSAPAGTNAPSSNPSGASGPSTGTPGAAQHEESEQPSPGTKQKGAQDRTIPEKQKSTQTAPSKGDKEQKSTQQTPSKGEHLKQQQGQTEQKNNLREGENATTKSGTQTKTGERAMTSKNVSLTTQQKTEIRSKVLTSSAPRVDHVDFDVRVGIVVPRTVHIVPVPTTLVEIEPAWRGFMYFVRGDEIIIVDPHSLEIVAVVEV
ncbi:MAG: DUF1236 domain-containing protein [Alphaproteobacteria bacterium]|nr:DUF1236 domain-containing protein [Alphaproteobacteria bacterium]